MNIKITNVPHLQTNFEFIEVGSMIRLIHEDERNLTGKLSRIGDGMIYIESKNGSEEVVKISDIRCCYRFE